MRTAVTFGVAGVLVLSGALGLARAPQPEQAAAVAGSTDTALVAGSQDLASTISALQSRVERVPADAAGWATLGLAYVEQAHLVGDPTYYDRARSAIDRSLALQPDDNANAEAVEAALAAARHEFGPALEAAERALALDPFDPVALPIRVDALTELGRYDEQLRALREADARRPGVPVSARYAYAHELRGELAKAASLLRRTLASATGKNRAFLGTQLADVERRRGRLGAAAAALNEAQRADPLFVAARISRARLDVARGRLSKALARWERIAVEVPLPEHAIELGELYEVLGRPAEARAQYDSAAAAYDAEAASGVAVGGEVAVFEADHGDPQAALEAARSEWSLRQSVHVADAYGWALHGVGRDRAALRLARQATRLGTAEAVLWLHRGAIEAALGMDGAARRHLTRGLAIDPGVSPLKAAQARELLSRLGER